MTLRKTNTRTIAALAIVAAALTPVTIAQEESGDKEIVARIGEEATVTRKEFDRTMGTHLQRLMVQVQMSGGNPSAIPRLSPEDQLELLDNIVRVKVEYVLAARAGLEPTEEEIKADIDTRVAGLPQNMTLNNYLERMGLNVAELSALLSQQMAIQRHREKVLEGIEVDDATLQEEYNTAKDSGQLDSVDVSHILIRVPEGAPPKAWTAAKEKIDAARKRIVEDGEVFGDVAKEVSEDPGSKDRGGSYPDTPRGRMVPEFDTLAFELPVGDVSEAFKTAFGWHILTPMDRRTLSFEDVSEKLREDTTNKMLQEKLLAMIEETKEEIGVEILLEPEEVPEEEPDSVETISIPLDQAT